MSCTLQHIPERLHKKSRPRLDIFEVGEEIYRRSDLEHLDNPFASISLRDISVNRQGLKENILSNAEDVLISTISNGIERYDSEICILKIKDLSEEGTYDKTFIEEKEDAEHTARIMLMHDPIPCMYPHCEFRLWFDAIHVSKDNYSETIGSKKYKKLRNQLRQSLAVMIIQREISQKG